MYSLSAFLFYSILVLFFPIFFTSPRFSNYLKNEFICFDHLNVGSITRTRGKFWGKTEDLLVAGCTVTGVISLGVLGGTNCEPICKFCDKKYARKGKFLLDHENSCLFNPEEASSTTYESCFNNPKWFVN